MFDRLEDYNLSREQRDFVVVCYNCTSGSSGENNVHDLQCGIPYWLKPVAQMLKYVNKIGSPDGFFNL